MKKTLKRLLVWVCYGGGTDSTAMIIQMVLRGEPIDLITFADTGAELPHTYRMVAFMDAWLKSMGYPGVTIVSYKTRAGVSETLEQSIVKNKTVPSLAFGWHTCSIRFKIKPQVDFAKKFEPFIEAWSNGEKVIRCIGYDFSPADSKRANRSTTNFPDLDLFENRYPLREWQWDREQCKKEIAAAGFPDPGKSSCYFCPARKAHEILEMRATDPDFYNRAIKIEGDALAGGKLRTVKGLGGFNFSWSNVHGPIRKPVAG